MLFIAFLLAIFFLYSSYSYHTTFYLWNKMQKYNKVFLFCYCFIYIFYFIFSLFGNCCEVEMGIESVRVVVVGVVLMRYTWDVLTKESCSQFSVAFTIYLCRCLVEKFYSFFFMLFVFSFSSSSFFSNQTSIVCFKIYFSLLTKIVKLHEII